MKLPAILLILSLVGAGATFAQVYSTNFDGTENPLSESGAWSHHGLDWTQAQKVNGVAYGTQTGDGGYDDSYAYLSGFPADQSGAGVIQRVSGDGGIHEVEILLRWSDSDHRAQGYECTLSYDGSYAQIVRWNGPYGDFTYIGWAPVAPLPRTGDTFSATITGALIIAYYNGAEIMRATDGTYATGNPGVGFFIQSNTGNGDMGFTSYTAMGLGSSDVGGSGAEGPPPPQQRARRIWLSDVRPNPCAGSSDLEYRTASPGPVDLGVYDLLGRRVATLVDGIMPAGRHLARMNGSALRRGVYIARLASDGEIEARKILVAR